MKEQIVTRRNFLRTGAATALAATIGFPLKSEADTGAAPDTSTAPAPKKTKVALIRDANVVDANGVIDRKIIEQMLDNAVATLVGKEDPLEAWKLLIKPGDIVGIKTNVWGPLRTPKEVEQHLKKRVMDAGVPEANVSVDDRGIMKNRIFLNATALINVRPMRTHHWCGVSGCIKNHIMFTSSPPDYHPDSCADLATLWSLPIIKGKTRLNVLILLTPLFHGIGPHHFDEEYTWPYKGILVGTDPVAVDATGLRIIEQKRLAYFGKEVPLKPSPKYIALADTRHKLGTSDPEKIELVKLGWQEGILI